MSHRTSLRTVPLTAHSTTAPSPAARSTMATPPPTSATVSAVKAQLDAMVVVHERHVIAIVADLVAARMETKMWAALQTAVYNYEPIGPCFGAQEDHRVWKRLHGALLELAAIQPKEEDLPVRRRFEQLRREWCSAAPSDADTNVEADPPVGPATSDESASMPGPSPGRAAAAGSSSRDNPAAASGTLPAFVKPSTPRKGLRGVQEFDEARRLAVGGLSGAAKKAVAGTPASPERARQADVCNASGAALALHDTHDSAADAALDRGTVLLEAARAIGEAAIALDSFTESRLHKLADDCKEPGHAAVLVPVLLSTGLATELGDALDTCSVELLKKFLDRDAKHLVSSVSSPLHVDCQEMDGEPGVDQ